MTEPGPPGLRRRARERALQALYQEDLQESPGFEVYWSHFGDEDEAARALAEELVRAVEADRERIDGLIESCSKNWRLDRMARVDRNVLRLATAEMLTTDVPRSVAINEAIEIARRYGAEGSAAFVNGVLDRIAEMIGR
jgi:transcription antitermination protein NusB